MKIKYKNSKWFFYTILIYFAGLILILMPQRFILIEVFLFFLTVVLSSYVWKLIGGLISSTASSIVFVIDHHADLTIEYLIAGVLLFCGFGTLLGVIFKHLDDQKKVVEKSEARYKELFEKFRRYFDLVQVMIVELDLNGNIVLANKKTSEVLGYRQDELIGMNWFEHFVPENIKNDLSQYFERVKTLRNGLIDYHENAIRCKDATEKIIAWHNVVIKDELDNVVGTLSAGLDITELRQTQERLSQQLRLSKDLYSIAEQLAVEGLNVQKRSNTLSRMCVELLGVSLAWVGYAAPDKSVKIVGSYPQNHPYLEGLIIRWDDSPYAQGAVGRSIKTGEPQIIEDVLTDERFIVWRDKIAPYGFKTVLSFPLISPKGVFGVLVLYSDKYGFFSREKVEQIRILSHLAAAALENARLFEELEKRFKRIQALHEIDRAISASTDLNLVLNVLLDQIMHQLNVDAVDVFLLNEHSMKLEYVAGGGFTSPQSLFMSFELGEGLIGCVGLNREPIVVKGNLCEFCEKFEGSSCRRKEIILQEGFKFYAAFPLIAKGKLLGVLEVFRRSNVEENEDWLEFLKILSNQAAIAIDNAKMFETLQKKSVELMRAYDETIEGWAHVLDLRDKETEGHSERVAELTLEIARRMNVREEDMRYIRWGALLHDIGKMAIPDRVLQKPGKLTDEEWQIMKMHPVYAYQMLSRIEYLRPALDIPYCHHERWDGTGYPRGLKGYEIPLSARIFAVVDVYDALTSDRPYRKAWTKEEAIEYIKNQSGKHFDPKVVDVFLILVNEWEKRKGSRQLG
ncbi:HD domain-containing phosphohydrolase [Pseudothermotoga sp.]|uniref:HD domain-containing phosphohydrolase n=1 Tax=Pseudothermotoga sp. TaxID=2033661 RepID=UPI0031F6A0AF